MKIYHINYKNIINLVEQKYKKKDLPLINIGDSIKIKLIVQEGNKERVQISEGVVISKHTSSLNTTITVRKIVQNIGVERVYLIHSPRILNIEILRQSKVRRAKLYYIRERSGKATRLKKKLD